MKPRPPVVVRLVSVRVPALRSALDVFARAAGHADFFALSRTATTAKATA